MRTLFIVALFIFSQLAHSVTSSQNCNKNTKCNSALAFQKTTLTDQVAMNGQPFHLLTWNVNLMSSWWIAQMFLYYINNQDMNDILSRAQLIADRLKEKNYDVIALQEVGDHASKKILDDTLSDAGYFSSEILGESWSHLNGVAYVFNGGVTLYSRHPFVALEYHTFSRGTWLQAYMPKGVVYGKIDIHGRVIHLFSLHLQSIQHNAQNEYDVLKKHQHELAQLIQSKQIAPEDHVFLLGDFNVDAQNYLKKQNEHSDFQEMLKILNAREIAPLMDCNPVISFDPAFNPMAKGKTPTGTLDNILCVNFYTCPYSGSRRIFRFDDTTTRLKELSDHYPMEALIFIP